MKKNKAKAAIDPAATHKAKIPEAAANKHTANVRCSRSKL